MNRQLPRLSLFLRPLACFPVYLATITAADLCHWLLRISTRKEMCINDFLAELSYPASNSNDTESSDRSGRACKRLSERAHSLLLLSRRAGKSQSIFCTFTYLNFHRRDAHVRWNDDFSSRNRHQLFPKRYFSELVIPCRQTFFHTRWKN